MQQYSEETYFGHSEVPLRVLEGMGSGAWNLSASNVCRISTDATLFSTSLPVFSHEKYVEGNELAGFENLAIRSLLPDDEGDLLAGATNDFDLSWLPNNVDDLEEFDFFGSGGGLELECDPQESLCKGMSKINLTEGIVGHGSPHYGFPNGVGTVSGEHPYGEHPSRTLFVRNINSNVEDSELRALFQQYGDIRNLYTACKHRGFVMISYYDIRAARTAMRALQNKPLRRRKLDIHFSIPKDNPSDKDINQGTLVVFNLDPSVSNDEVHQIFGAYGEVKEIRETPHKRHHKFIEFYDVRAAEAALKALNKSDINGKRIKLEPSRPGGARRNHMLNMNQEGEQDESGSFRHQTGSSTMNSPPGSWPQFGSPIDHTPLQKLGNSLGLRRGSSPIGSNLPGLASILHPQMSNAKRIAPIGYGRFGKSEHKFTNADSNSGGVFQQSHSFPEQIPNQHTGAMSSFGASSSNDSGFETLSGPQFLWGSPNAYPEQNNSARGTSSVGHPFPSNWQDHGFPFTGHQGSCLGSTQHHHHNVGSAPPGFPARRHFGFYQQLPETSFLHPPAFGVNAGAHAAMNTSAAVTGNMSESASPGFRMTSSPRLDPLFPGNSDYPGHIPASLEGFERRWRQLVAKNGNLVGSKKQFQLDLDRIQSGEDTRTTIMIKNIPNKYTSKMLLAAIDANHRGTYNFFYLPIDFKNKCNVGYAFINMLSPSHIIPFYEAFNGKKWEKFNSEKVALLAYARIQGLAALVHHFQNSGVMNEDRRCRPIIFHSDRLEAGDQIIQEHHTFHGLNIQILQSNMSHSKDSPASTSEGCPDENPDKSQQL
ncbi:protein MEI2-like 5 isoform X2 [Diospyros lotus]|uniref:protein MEI2-like 5 isoform X2 n=1 Tax=Diospyros lotus TaxID=55363 RepID=UPI0022518853|nr:protein MEI2-like 5 isoform X2 [Diospyros lotus]